MARKTSKSAKQVETLTHEEATRPNTPTAEYQSVMSEDQQEPVLAAYERRLRVPRPRPDPQLVWRGG